MELSAGLKHGSVALLGVVVLGIIALCAREQASNEAGPGASRTSARAADSRTDRALSVESKASLVQASLAEQPDRVDEAVARDHSSSTNIPGENSTRAEMEAFMAKAQRSLPQPTPQAVDQRNDYLQKLVRSGSGGSQWLDHFERVQDDWLEIDQRDALGIEFAEWKCYKDGCTTTLRADSVEALDRFSASVMNGKTTREWRGAGFRSGPIRVETGELESTWIFYAPPS